MKDIVHIIDFYNPNIYPGDLNAKNGISTTQHVYYQHEDNAYLDLMKKIIELTMD